MRCCRRSTRSASSRTCCSSTRTSACPRRRSCGSSPTARDVVGAPVPLKGRGPNGERLFNVGNAVGEDGPLSLHERVGTAVLLLSRRAVDALVDDAKADGRVYDRMATLAGDTRHARALRCVPGRRRRRRVPVRGLLGLRDAAPARLPDPRRPGDRRPPPRHGGGLNEPASRRVEGAESGHAP